MSYLWQAQLGDDMKEECEEEEAGGKKYRGKERQGLFRSSLGSFSTLALHQSRWRRCSVYEMSSVGVMPSFPGEDPCPPPLPTPEWRGGSVGNGVLSVSLIIWLGLGPRGSSSVAGYPVVSGSVLVLFTRPLFASPRRHRYHLAGFHAGLSGLLLFPIGAHSLGP